ncbi:MAG: response regulator [Ktedonobacterales bacterium]
MHRVLVVEDEHPLRRILTLNLARRGYSVAEAGSVAEAEEAIEASGVRFDLILLDINLPDLTGWDLLRHIATREATPPSARPAAKVIVITATRPAQCRLDEFHPDAVLVKPFPISTFLRLVERIFDERSVGNRLARLS